MIKRGILAPSKQLWLQAGDKNIKYFHAACNARQSSNSIVKLKDEDGNWLVWQNGLDQYITSYYQGLFMATHTNNDEVMKCIKLKVSQEHNLELLHEITEEEVKKAIFQMNSNKAPGPDGMTPAFFQKSRGIVGRDVVDLVRNFFATGEILQGLNDTNLVLVPKKKTQQW